MPKWTARQVPESDYYFCWITRCSCCPLPVVPVALAVAAASHSHPLPAPEPVHVARLPELPSPREAPDRVPGGNSADLLAQQLSRHKPAHRLPGLLLALHGQLGPELVGCGIRANTETTRKICSLSTKENILTNDLPSLL